MKLVILLLLAISGIACKTKEEWKKRSIYQLLTDRFARGDGKTPACNDLLKYCGGDYQGLIDQLDYIKNMGFDAIWISPIVENTPDSYHGYHLTDLEKVNTNFGDEAKIRELVEACHKKDIWVMLDVVANHVGPVGTDYGRIKQFDKAEYYHDICQITDWENQEQVENCRLADLPDLKQENPYVEETLLQWIEDIVQRYDFDGIRIDTIPEVPKPFWEKFIARAGVFQIGEVFNSRPWYVASYQNHMESVFNYPLYYAVERSMNGSMRDLESYHFRERTEFPEAEVLGVFIENHDNPRFLNRINNHNKFTNAAVLNIMWEGIPVWYYGGEQYYAGGADPNNREVLWGNYNTESELYKKLAIANKIRKEKQLWATQQVQRYADDNFYAFTRGDVLVALTNSYFAFSRDITYHDYKNGDKFVNALDPNDVVYVDANKIEIKMNLLPKIYVKQ